MNKQKSMKTLYKHPTESPGYLLWRLTTNWQQQLRQALLPLELTHVQFVFLACLQWLTSQDEKNITQSHVAKLAGLDKMVISDTTKKLMAKKLILRHTHKIDNRAFTLKITKAGQDKLNQALPLVEQIDLKYFKENTQKFIDLKELVTNID